MERRADSPSPAFQIPEGNESGDLWNNKDRKGGSAREEACTGHPRVLKYLFVDKSR